MVTRSSPAAAHVRPTASPFVCFLLYPEFTSSPSLMLPSMPQTDIECVWIFKNGIAYTMKSLLRSINRVTPPATAAAQLNNLFQGLAFRLGSRVEVHFTYPSCFTFMTSNVFATGKSVRFPGKDYRAPQSFGHL